MRKPLREMNPQWEQKRKSEQDQGHGYFRDPTVRDKLFQRLQQEMMRRRQIQEQKTRQAREEEL